MTDSNLDFRTNQSQEDTKDSYHELLDIEEGGKYKLSKEEIDKQIDERFEKFYSRVYPGFTLSSGTDTLAHGRSELCLTQ